MPEKIQGPLRNALEISELSRTLENILEPLKAYENTSEYLSTP